ncbi:hypothetical protein VHEMI06397 [[Torrubiella] hemipterigena]|uniref:Uncharacterized protein n=1 Tax=[Torrubiella] hemipterigena TaxID=1531966 RepID=A0A0A1T759_9HYPO|nr:hypothetical protein VHEMI06397 [[Torrubiella] hemipterigena]
MSDSSSSIHSQVSQVLFHGIIVLTKFVTLNEELHALGRQPLQQDCDNRRWEMLASEAKRHMDSLTVFKMKLEALLSAIDAHIENGGEWLYEQERSDLLQVLRDVEETLAEG